MKEQDLAKSIYPIRHMFRAQALHILFESGLFETLKENRTRGVSELARYLDMVEDRLEGFLIYLRNEGIVEMSDQGHPALSAAGLAYTEARPWYQLLVGGYGRTLFDLRAILKDRSVYGTRVGASVGIGSCGISQYDALPMTRKLILESGPTPTKIIDVGCGDGSYLIDLCKGLTGISAIGMEPDRPSAEIAVEMVAAQGLSDRIRIEVGGFSGLTEPMALGDAPVFIMAFVLQEVLEQAGRAAIIEGLSRLRGAYSGARIVVIEVDRADSDAKKMCSDLGLAYYNPYFLIHHVTEQKLETADFWDRVFSEAGWAVATKCYPDRKYDSLELKTGYLLQRASTT